MFVLATVVAGGWLLRGLCFLARQIYGLSRIPLVARNAIVVLGGGLETRPFVAAELWRRSLADKILISQPPEERAVSIGAMPSHSELIPNR
jgi:hypothetical protein